VGRPVNIYDQNDEVEILTWDIERLHHRRERHLRLSGDWRREGCWHQELWEMNDALAELRLLRIELMLEDER